MALGPTHPPYSMDTGGYFADSKMAKNSPSSGTEIKNECNYTSHPLYAFILWTQTSLCLLSSVFTMNCTN